MFSDEEREREYQVDQENEEMTNREKKKECKERLKK